jgi:murein hydrolase activator
MLRAHGSLSLKLISASVVGLLLTAIDAEASLPARTMVLSSTPPPATLNEKLLDVRNRMMTLEEQLLDSVHSQKKAKEAFQKIQELLMLQKRERSLARHRISQLETTIQDLEIKRTEMNVRVELEKKSLRKSLIDIHRNLDLIPESPEQILSLEIDQPRLKLIRNLAATQVREIETVRADLLDAETLESRITEERSQVDALIHELAESESLLELNRKLQIDLIRQTHHQRLGQLEKYRAMKAAESQVSVMIKDFNSRMEIQDTIRKERSLAGLLQTPFGKQKGHLGLPLASRVVGQYGKSFDPASGLSVFRKGIDIETKGNELVTAVFEGKVAYAGEMPNYGKMIIIDHGSHFYSICGNLGEISLKVGEKVAQGSKIGVTEFSGKSLYFEIRARNIPVDPLQWISRTVSMK